MSAAAALSSTSTMAERAKSRITSTSQPEQQQQQQQLDQERSQQQSMALSKTSSTTNNDIGNKDRDNRISQLEKENAELRSELSAFDLDFFEEIEDLKFKYAEAAKKCRAFDEYVRINPPRH
jgi:hypothetical protein